MNKLIDFTDPSEPISPSTTGAVVYARFQAEPDTLALAVVDEDRRPIGLVDRGIFFLRMAAEFGRALYGNRPITFLMEPPRTERADISVMDFMAGVISSERAGLMRGFIVVDNRGRYLAVGTPLSLLVSGHEAAKARIKQLDRQRASLARANQKAEAAARAKAQFLATMSHEIRTPLNGVLAVAEIVGLKLTQEELRPYIRTILDSGHTLHRLLTDALDLSRAEAGAMELVPAPFSPSAMAEDVSALWGPLAENKGLSLTVDLQTSIDEALVADAMRVKQVINNLVGNALKFTEQGGITVRVLVASGSDGRARFAVEVEDTGPGIAAGQLERIFEPFAKTDEHAAAGGAGLGLSICHRLVDAMGGRIGAQSTAGKGALFHFELLLPVVTAQAPVVAAETDCEPGLEAQGARVLIVDDNPTNRLVASTFMEMAGFAFATAADGLEAVEACRTEHFDLILMDINMPRMGGLEASRLIRESAGPSARSPILAVTANSDPSEVATYMAAGMSGVVTKPLRAEDLFSAMQEAIAASPPARAAA